jgi:FixJ family two-component response regulator
MTLDNFILNKKDEMFLDKKQVYIVDDDDSLRRSLKLLLVSYGFAVETFSSAEEYFKVVPNNAKCCLVLDIHMPVLNGWDALKRLTEAGYNHPVIVITADKGENLRDKALKAGAVGFLQKPFSDHYLLHMVTHVFNKQEKEMKKLNEQELEDTKALGALKDNFRLNTTGTDDDLGLDIQDAIGQDGSLTLVSNNIQVTVEDGIVTLDGDVYSDHEKMTAGDLTAALAGEDNVNNYLRVVESED